MAHTYNDLLTDLNSRVRNQVNSVTNVRSHINSSIRAELADFDYQSVMRHTLTLRAVYDNAFLYPLPSDMNDEALVDIHKYKDFDQGSGVNFRKVDIRKFNSNKARDTFAFDYSDNVKWMKANFSTSKGDITLHKMNSLTDNGTWAAADDGTNIAVSTSNRISGTGSISVDGNAGTAVAIENSTITSALDVSSATKLFLWVFFPTTTVPTSITLLYGSSAANYFTTTATTPFNVDSFQAGWNFVGFDVGTEVGAPDNTAIDYIKVTNTFAAANSDTILIDSIFAAQGDPFEMVYYSIYGWRNTNGTWKENSTANEDLLNAESAEYEIFVSRCARDIARALPMSTEDQAVLEAHYREVKKRYVQKYPSLRKKLKSFY